MSGPFNQEPLFPPKHSNTDDDEKGSFEGGVVVGNNFQSNSSQNYGYSGTEMEDDDGGQSIRSPEDVNKYNCALCQTKTSGPENLQQHLQGQKHKANLEKSQKRKEGGDGPSEEEDKRWYCELCECKTTSPENLEAHMHGQKHKANMDKMANKDTNPFPKGYRPSLREELVHSVQPLIGLDYLIEFKYKDPNRELFYECSVCSQVLVNGNVISHMMGQKHRLKYVRKYKLELFDEHLREYEHISDVKVSSLSEEDKGRRIEMTRKLREVAEIIEKMDGRDRMKLVIVNNTRVPGSGFKTPIGIISPPPTTTGAKRNRSGGRSGTRRQGDGGPRSFPGRNMGGWLDDGPGPMHGRDIGPGPMHGRDIGPGPMHGRDIGPGPMHGRDIGPMHGRDIGPGPMHGRDIGPGPMHGRDIGPGPMGGRNIGPGHMGGGLGPMGNIDGGPMSLGNRDGGSGPMGHRDGGSRDGGPGPMGPRDDGSMSMDTRAGELGPLMGIREDGTGAMGTRDGGPGASGYRAGGHASGVSPIGRAVLVASRQGNIAAGADGRSPVAGAVQASWSRNVVPQQHHVGADGAQHGAYGADQYGAYGADQYGAYGADQYGIHGSAMAASVAGPVEKLTDDAIRREFERRFGDRKRPFQPPLPVGPPSKQPCPPPPPSGPPGFTELLPDSSDKMQNLLNELSTSMINNEEDAAMALQVSNTLTQALLNYRLKSMPGAAELFNS